ncbi:hypothetical protein N8K70_03930 [Microbacterium betulae]|uniref:Uncharacterized protein n=1 Tax=Microbacterium betulae TaxID=2981139 RepID=A0AA97FK82_9MICO|nr:hypothetical protein [Microbacterium sp. AB]WOF23840.1 hypothetical protein N8K70_03930 [Microbacterium sp. AB]
MTGTPVVIGGDDIVTALEAQLKGNVPLVIEALKLERLGEVKTWQVVPDADAISAAQLPAVAIVTPRVSTQPRGSHTEYSADWEVSVGVFARGKDHEETQTQIQAWAKVLRVAALLSRTLTGTRIEMRWAGELYDLIPTKQDARTIAGAEVLFDAHVDTALDLTSLRRDPTLISVHPNVQPH